MKTTTIPTAHAHVQLTNNTQRIYGSKFTVVDVEIYARKIRDGLGRVGAGATGRSPPLNPFTFKCGVFNRLLILSVSVYCVYQYCNKRIRASDIIAANDMRNWRTSDIAVCRGRHSEQSS